MNEKTRLNINAAIHGLNYSADLLEQALGGKPGRNQQRVWNGPFAHALHRVAEITDGAEIQDIGIVRRSEPLPDKTLQNPDSQESITT